jgi:hypothetical protein
MVERRQRESIENKRNISKIIRESKRKIERKLAHDKEDRN